MQQLPLGNGSAKLVVGEVSSEGGYTPGDTWDLYVGKDNRVEQFIYHRGGSMKPSVVIATWEGYKKAGPLLISTDHKGTADGNPLRIFISDVSVRADRDQITGPTRNDHRNGSFERSIVVFH